MMKYFVTSVILSGIENQLIQKTILILRTNKEEFGAFEIISHSRNFCEKWHSPVSFLCNRIFFLEWGVSFIFFLYPEMSILRCSPPPGGYYLTSAYGAMALIKNFQEEQAARVLSSEARNTLHQWHRRRTAQRAAPTVDDFQVSRLT